MIKICQAILPEDKKQLPEVIDTTHRLGTKNAKEPRSIMIQFSSWVHRAAVWLWLWPAVEAARKEGKMAFFVGGRGFTEYKEILPSP